MRLLLKSFCYCLNDLEFIQTIQLLTLEMHYIDQTNRVLLKVGAEATLVENHCFTVSKCLRAPRGLCTPDWETRLDV